MADRPWFTASTSWRRPARPIESNQAAPLSGSSARSCNSSGSGSQPSTSLHSRRFSQTKSGRSGASVTARVINVRRWTGVKVGPKLSMAAAARESASPAAINDVSIRWVFRSRAACSRTPSEAHPLHRIMTNPTSWTLDKRWREMDCDLTICQSSVIWCCQKFNSHKFAADRIEYEKASYHPLARRP